MKQFILWCFSFCVVSQGFGQLPDKYAYLRVNELDGAAVDTTTMKAIGTTVGALLFLKELSSGDGIGGGWFTLRANTDYTANSITVFDAPGSNVWVRREFLDEPSTINAEWGGVVGDNTTDNQSMLQAVALLSSNLGARLELPKDTIFVDPAAGDVVVVTKDLEIFGQGESVTFVRVPSTATTTYSLFEWDSNARGTVKDMHLIGPTDIGLTVAPRAINGATSDYLRVERVKMTGQWGRNVRNGDGGSIEIINCDFEAGNPAKTSGEQSHNVFMGAGSPGTISPRLIIIESRFTNNSASINDHCLYPDPGTSIYINRGHFIKTAGWALHVFGTTTIKPDFWEVRNSIFETACVEGMFTPIDADGSLLDNVIMRAPIRVRGSVQISNSHFSSNGGVFGYTSGLDATDKIIVGPKNTFVSTNIQADNGTDTRWLIYKNIFEGTSRITHNTGSPIVRIKENVFDLTGTIYIRPGTGKAYVVDNVFDGNPTEGAVYLEGDGEVEVSLNNFSDMTGIAVRRISGTTLGIVYGHGNRFGAATVQLNVTNDYGKLHLRDGLDPTSKASAGNLFLSRDFDTYHVTGTTVINNLYVGTLAAEVDMFSGSRVNLIVDGAWSTSTTGNLKPSTNTVRTVNGVVSFVYDAVTGFWYEGEVTIPVFKAIYSTDDSLWASWPLFQGLGTVAYDIGPYARDGILTDGPTWVPGLAGFAVRFDGTNDFIEIPDYRPSASDFTAEAWFELDLAVSATSDIFPIFGNNQNTPFLGYDPVSELFSHLRQHSGGSEIETWDASSLGNLADSVWHHAVLVVSQVTFTAKLFVDGISLGSETIGTEGYTVDAGDLQRIGKDFASFWQGALAELRVYGRAMSDDEALSQHVHGTRSNATILADKFRIVGTDGVVDFEINEQDRFFFRSALTDDPVFIQILEPNIATDKKLGLLIGKAFSSGNCGFFTWIQGSTPHLELATFGSANPIKILASRLEIPTGNMGLGGVAATSAKLDIQSTTGALLLSRMTTTQRDALTAVNGMAIYNSTTNAFNFYENGSWVTK